MKRTEGAKQLREQMAARGLNQTQLAARIGVNQSMVSQWLHGRARPKPHHRLALVNILGIAETAWLTAKEAALVERSLSGAKVA